MTSYQQLDHNHFPDMLRWSFRSNLEKIFFFLFFGCTSPRVSEFVEYLLHRNIYMTGNLWEMWGDSSTNAIKKGRTWREHVRYVRREKSLHLKFLFLFFSFFFLVRVLGERRDTVVFWDIIRILLPLDFFFSSISFLILYYRFPTWNFPRLWYCICQITWGVEAVKEEII